LVQYKVIYKDVDPKLFEFYRVVYIGVIALILAVFTFPHALEGSTPLLRTFLKRGTLCQRSVHVQTQKI
jgi:hypothetical protein